MNLDTMIIEVWDGIGRPTDLSPLDRLDDLTTINNTLYGYITLQRWINQGYKAITTWRTPGGKFYRSDDMVDRKYIQWGPYASTAVPIPNTDPSFEGGYDNTQHEYSLVPDDFYVDNTPPAMVVLGLSNLGDPLLYEDVDPGLQYQIVDPGAEYQDMYKVLDEDWSSLAYFTDAHTLYTLKPLPWVVDETKATIYERGINWRRWKVINELNDLYAIRSIRVIDLKRDTELSARTENFTHNLAQVGEPKQYFREGRYVYFDRHIDQEYTLQLEYYREAKDLVNGTDVPELPERLHTPIVYWATQRGLLSRSEQEDAASMNDFLRVEMTSIITEQDLNIERLEGNFIAGITGTGGYTENGR